MKNVLRTLEIRDLLKQPLEIGDSRIRLDAEVNATFRWPAFGIPELDSLEIKDVYLYAPELVDDLILLEPQSLRTRQKALFADFERAVEALARAEMAKVPEYAWDEHEEVNI
jgi:hypothetical protein